MNGYEVIWSGEEKKHRNGVDFILSPRVRKALLGYKPVNSRIMVARFDGKPLNVSVVQVYAITSDNEKEEMEFLRSVRTHS